MSGTIIPATPVDKNTFAATVASLISGSAFAGLNAGGMIVTLAGGAAGTLAARFGSRPLSFEADFGAATDGVTDCSGAFAAALSSGVPVEFGPRSYVVNAATAITASNIVAFGTPGVTRIVRTAAPSGTWINLNGSSVTLDGLIFDGNSVSSSNLAVQIGGNVTALRARRCQFKNAPGSAGLTVAGNPSGTPSYEILDCDFLGNGADGLALQDVWNAVVVSCRARSNGGNGIVCNASGVASGSIARRVLIALNDCQANGAAGISVGNYNTGTVSAPVWGPTSPQIEAVAILGNSCAENSGSQIAAANDYVVIANNQITRVAPSSQSGAGINANVRWSRITGNMLNVSACSWGIDTGGSQEIAISGNSVFGGGAGLNVGGSVNVTVEGNTLTGQTFCGISIYAVEDDGNGRYFPFFAQNITIRGNRFTVSSGAKGIVARDNPAGLAITGNDFIDGGAGNPIAAMDIYGTPLIEGNRWNGVRRYTTNPFSVSGGVQNLIEAPDVYDEIEVTNNAVTIGDIIPPDTLTSVGQVAWLQPVSGGTGYTHATVSISGDGSGAAFTPYVAGGAVIGFRLVTPGSGYTHASVTITGDGSGASANAQIGVPLPPGRALRLIAQNGCTLTRAGSDGIPFLNTGTTDLTFTNQAIIAISESYGQWIAR